jgi:hypothetical protein
LDKNFDGDISDVDEDDEEEDEIDFDSTTNDHELTSKQKQRFKKKFFSRFFQVYILIFLVNFKNVNIQIQCHIHGFLCVIQSFDLFINVFGHFFLKLVLKNKVILFN